MIGVEISNPCQLIVLNASDPVPDRLYPLIPVFHTKWSVCDQLGPGSRFLRIDETQSGQPIADQSIPGLALRPNFLNSGDINDGVEMAGDAARSEPDLVQAFVRTDEAVGLHLRDGRNGSGDVVVAWVAGPGQNLAA